MMRKTIITLLLIIATLFMLSMPAFAATANYYVAGDFNNYANPDEALKMKNIGGDMYAISATVPAGTHKYKITDGTWDVTFGKDNYVNPNPVAVEGMGDIGFKVDAETKVYFVFNAKTKKIADSTFYTFVQPFVVGDFLSKTGGKDWDPASANTLLLDPDFDGIYTGTFKLPAGSFKYKITIGRSWDECYGIDGATSGMDTNMILDLKSESNVTFNYNSETHITKQTIVPVSASETSTSSAGGSDSETSPKTGDTGLLIPLAGFILSGTAAMVIKKRMKK